jgi:reactive intermediate/imine deaminase
LPDSNIPRRQEVAVANLLPAISHYADAVRFDDLVFISGLTPHDASGKLIGEGDAAAQTEQILQNMGKVLAAAGGSFADVLKVTVFLTDLSDRTRINPVRQKYFGAAKPASSLFGVTGLALPGMKVEIEAIAGIPANRRTSG